MERVRFLRLVRRALDGLPSEQKGRLANVDVAVRRRPTPRQLRENGLERGESLYGLYEGIPLTERGGYDPVLPDVITIFQEPLVRDFRGERELMEQVRVTVLHELAHFFGMSDEALEKLGLE